MGSAVSGVLCPKQKWPVTLMGHEGGVNAICIRTDGSLIATASEDSTARVWESVTFSLESQMTGHTQYISCIDMNEDVVVTGSADKLIKKWDIFSGCHLVTYSGHESVITKVLIHGNHLFSAALDKTARHWDLKSGDCLHIYHGHSKAISCLLFINLMTQDRRPERRKSRSKIERKLSTTTRFSSAQHKALLITGNTICIVVMEGYHVIATGSADNTARAWTLQSDNNIVIFKGHGSAVLCMAASEPDRELFTGSSDGTARSWNVETGQAIRVFEGHQAPVTCLQVG